MHETGTVASSTSSYTKAVSLIVCNFVINRCIRSCLRTKFGSIEQLTILRSTLRTKFGSLEQLTSLRKNKYSAEHFGNFRNFREKKKPFEDVWGLRRTGHCSKDPRKLFPKIVRELFREKRFNFRRTQYARERGAEGPFESSFEGFSI